jgi:hypothetical protein
MTLAGRMLAPMPYLYITDETGAEVPGSRREEN